ncbi:MAG: lipo-like protein [Pseudomonadales bacterium]
MSARGFEKLGHLLADVLSRPRRSDTAPAPAAPEEEWQQLMRPGDVLLVEGRTRISTGIKYLTQSTWSHSALYVGSRCPQGPLIEADLTAGVIASPMEKYRDANVRICRPIGLSSDDLHRVLDFAIARLGNRYDLRNVFDLARYLFPTPPVPPRWRRRLLTFGSGEPTKAICSSLVAQAFQQVHYPILPHTVWSSEHPDDRYLRYQIRHYSTFTPRDFDLSPYFDIVKPKLRTCFDYRTLQWLD